MGLCVPFMPELFSNNEEDNNCDDETFATFHFYLGLRETRFDLYGGGGFVSQVGGIIGLPWLSRHCIIYSSIYPSGVVMLAGLSILFISFRRDE